MHETADDAAFSLAAANTPRVRSAGLQSAFDTLNAAVKAEPNAAPS